MNGRIATNAGSVRCRGFFEQEGSRLRSQGYDLNDLMRFADDLRVKVEMLTAEAGSSLEKPLKPSIFFMPQSLGRPRELPAS